MTTQTTQTTQTTAQTTTKNTTPTTTIQSCTRLQSYQTHLFSRSLPRKIFQICDSRSIHQTRFTMDIWIAPGAHTCSLATTEGCATELVTDNPYSLPETGLLNTLLCSADKDIKHKIPRTNIGYITSAQTEQLSNHIYNETYNELDELARDQNALTHRWEDRIGQCLSIVDSQKFADQIHIQAYHMIASENLVLRTQSIFDLISPQKK